jgi:hypothetical protein
MFLKNFFSSLLKKPLTFMAKIALVHPRETINISVRTLIRTCDLFGDDPALTASPYHVTSQVSLSVFREFVSVLEGADVTIKNNNFRSLSQLCDEFRFRELAAQLSRFRESGDFNEDAVRLSELEQRMDQRDLEIEVLRQRVAQLEADGVRPDDQMRLSAVEEQMQQREQEIEVLQGGLSRQLDAHESAEKRVQAEVGKVRREIEGVRDMLREAENASQVEVTALRSIAETVTASALTQLQADVQRLKDFMLTLPPPAQTPPYSTVPTGKPTPPSPDAQQSVSPSTASPPAPSSSPAPTPTLTPPPIAPPPSTTDFVTLRVKLPSGLLNMSISFGRDWTGAAALHELLRRVHINNHHTLRPSFDRGTRGQIDLNPAKLISEHDLVNEDTFHLEGECHYIDAAFSHDLCLSFSNYTCIRLLGRGPFADVYLYCDNTTGGDVVVKLPSVWNPLNRDFQDFIRQIEIMRLMNHHCVLKICGIFDSTPDRSIPAIVLPFMVNQSVADYLQLMKTAPAPDWTYTRKYIICYGIALGMAALHARAVIHRDLKPSNILLDENLDPKVSGFGLSKIMIDPTLEQSHCGGTTHYKAPEVLVGNEFYGQPVDVYSFAISVFVILTGLEPYPKATDYVHARRVAVEKIRPTIPWGIPRGIADLMASCWNDRSADRPTFEQIRATMEEDPLLENVDREQFRAFQARVAAESVPAGGI